MYVLGFFVRMFLEFLELRLLQGFNLFVLPGSGPTQTLAAGERISKGWDRMGCL